MNQKRTNSGYTTGVLIGNITAWVFVVIVLGTILGTWIKLFWLGWVFAGVL